MVLSLGDCSYFLLILVTVLLVSAWIHIRRGHRYSCQRLSRSAAYFPSRGRARWVGRRRWSTVTTSPILQGKCLFISLMYLFLGINLCSFKKGMVSYLFMYC